MTERELLQKVSILSELDPADLDIITSKVVKKSYGKNAMILMEDEFGDSFFAITRGKVKIIRLDKEGREVVLAILGEGQFFGEMSLFRNEPRSANVVTLEPSDVLMLRREHFSSVLEEHPGIGLALLREMARRLRRIAEQIEALALNRAEQQVSSALLKLTDDFGIIRNWVVRVEQLPSQEDIANMAGTSRGTVSRTMKMLEEKGLIRRQGRSLEVLNYSQFRRLFG